MKASLPRWVAFASALITTIVGMLGFASIASGLIVYESPHAVRDGQYMMGVGMFAAVGFWGALPVAILSSVLVYRDPRFFLPHALAIGGVGALAIAGGLLLTGLSAGLEGVLAALTGLLVSPLGLVVAPLLLLERDTYIAAASVGICLALVVLGTYFVVRRR
ncbi:MAG: hypothetical protein NZ843_05655 [Fimbriimonadales bacterium]|nr:hypothetical protein [Fimbriimonadales bacterium]